MDLRAGLDKCGKPHPRFDPRTVQPVASHYTDYAIPALNGNVSSAENVKGSEGSGIPTIVTSSTCIKRNLLGTEKKRNSFPCVSVIVLHCIISWVNHDFPAPRTILWTALCLTTRRHVSKDQNSRLW